MTLWQSPNQPQLQAPPQSPMATDSIPASLSPRGSPVKVTQQNESVERDAPAHLTPKEKLKWRKQERQRIEDLKTKQEVAANIAAKQQEAQARETSRARDFESDHALG